MLTVGSLFSGIGGIDLGLERAGMQVRWQVEIDPFCNKVLAKHWPEVTRYGDIRAMDWTTVEPVDVVAGGFPCQPVSLAGKGLGRDDERWMWPEFARCIRSVRPRFVLVENVPGLLGRGMGDVLGDLAGCGYDAEWQSLPAAAFGAPQIRERVFVVAYATEKRSTPCKVFLRVPNQACIHSSEHWRGARRIHGRSGRVRLAPNHGVCLLADGLPGELVELGALGNAVVPQVVEWIGRRIVAAEEQYYLIDRDMLGTCRKTCLAELCAWWDPALDKCMVVAINDLMHSMYGGEKQDL